MKKLNKKRSVVPLLTDPPQIKKINFCSLRPPKNYLWTNENPGK